MTTATEITRVQISPSIIERIASAVCLDREMFYVQEADVTVNPGEQYPTLRARLNIAKPGHYKVVPELTHAPDSLAALGQLGYLFFAQTSLADLMPNCIPGLAIEQIIETFKNTNGKWAYLKRLEADFKHLPPSCMGRMRIKKVSPAPEGYFFDAQVSFAESSATTLQDIHGPSNHLYECRFAAKF